MKTLPTVGYFILAFLGIFIFSAAIWFGTLAAITPAATALITIKVIFYAFLALSILGYVVLLIMFFVELDEPGDTPLYRFYQNDKNEKERKKTQGGSTEDIPEKTFCFKIRWILIPLTLLFLFICGRSLISDNITLYNKAQAQQNAFKQKQQERAGFYDQKYLTFQAKANIAGINKETFITVTQIIMENRADGKNLSWKWVRENQNIDYSEFTKFYADLSVFIAEQNLEYFNIEKACQQLAIANNMLLDTFPHNIYNKVLKLPHLTFKYGLLSDTTRAAFKDSENKPDPKIQ